MPLLKIIQTPEEEYKLFKEDLQEQNPNMMILPQKYNNDVYIEKKINMPIVLKMFLGGLSVVGLYMVYKMTNAKK